MKFNFYLSKVCFMCMLGYLVVKKLFLSLTVELLASSVMFCGGSEGTSDSVLHTTSSVLEPGPF